MLEYKELRLTVPYPAPFETFRIQISTESDFCKFCWLKPINGIIKCRLSF